MPKPDGWVKIDNLETIEPIIQVHKTGDYFNWKKFRREPIIFYLFTQRGVFKYTVDKKNE